MDKFRQACIMSNSLWVDSFSSHEEEHIFSKKHERIMKRLIETVERGKYYKLKRAAYIAIIAAVIITLIVCATAVAVPHTNDYVITEFGTYAEYDVIYDSNDIPGKVSKLTVGYLPEGYEPEKLKDYERAYFYSYSCEGTDKYITVSKGPLSGSRKFDTEFYPYEIIKYGGIDHIVFQGNELDYGVIWNEGGCSYCVIVSGETKEEAIKIAKKVK